MKTLTGKDREETIKDMISAAVVEFGISKDQATKRVNKLLQAIDNGHFRHSRYHCSHCRPF